MRLARAYATTQPAAIRTLIGMEHHANGAMTFRTIGCLPALVGAWRRRGGGIPVAAVFHFAAINAAAVEMPELEDPTIRAVNMVQIGQALTSTELDPPIRALIVYSSNPAAIAPNQNLVRQGLAREDLFTVVHEQFMTDTATLRRLRAAGDDPGGTAGLDVVVGPYIPEPQPAGNCTHGGGGLEYGIVPPPGGRVRDGGCLPAYVGRGADPGGLERRILPFWRGLPMSACSVKAGRHSTSHRIGLLSQKATSPRRQGSASSMRKALSPAAWTPYRRSPPHMKAVWVTQR